MKVEREIKIENELGLHARPAALFVQLANKFASDILVEKDGDTVSGKSIMGIMMLAAGKGAKIKIIAEGNDADEAVRRFEELIVNKFGEDD
ncbi:MAG: HPr family phosphocarrier protein [Candidatus Tritonobacter lacicola]|nr:HPr family phosphocarrier protein [Candidatus Tritonobacter lacicola]